ncbi:hypothetical protein [Heyndrickxia sporothermodurans]|uniref:hypothetical protein n=1 Tax=Heyndrickxia sporothermodurans TaxID=46224 RepID=UPI000D381F1D|nr:hypothetical protein [Heyndrickxia sporothermodurans]PTY92919.1 hypothetical protein B5V90_02240 [Heyndrickxia sporothermodurans]
MTLLHVIVLLLIFCVLASLYIMYLTFIARNPKAIVTGSVSIVVALTTAVVLFSYNFETVINQIMKLL